MAPPAPAPARPETLRSYRLLLLLIAGGNAALALAHHLDGADAADPLWVRLGVSALALALAATLETVGVVRRHARMLVYSAAYVVVAVSAALLAWNAFAPSYALGHLAVVAALGLGGAVTSRRSGAVQGLMATAVLLPLAALVLAPAPPGVGRATFLLSLFLTAGIAAVLARERARVSARISGQQARYQSVFDQVGDGLYLADAATRRILDANPAMLRLSGYSLDEVRRLRIDDLIAVGPGETPVADNVRTVRATREIVLPPRRMRTAAGALLDVEVSATVIDTGDGADTMCVVVRDATERTRAERALCEAAAEAQTARARAEELLRLKASFLANMSHEIRTPLTAILGYAELLADEVSGDAREMVDVIARGATRLHRTLNSVLDLARLDADQRPLGGVPVDLAEEAEAAVAALRPLACAKGLEITAVSTAGPVWACADPSAVARILDNLVGNAIKFTTAGCVTVAVSSDGHTATLSVCDTGPGIPDAFRASLFDEFRQASTGHGRTHEGSGLGLAITHRLVERLGGAIAVESAEGCGAAFTVSLPAAAPTDIDVSAPAAGVPEIRTEVA